MSELNDDMDELFRRAAENYPLKTDSADWNKLNNALQASDATAVASTVEVKKKNYRRLLWFAFLLLIPWICYRNQLQPDHLATVNAVKNNPANAALNETGKKALLHTHKKGIEKSINKKNTLGTQELNNKNPTIQNGIIVPESSTTAKEWNTDQQKNADKVASSIINENTINSGANENTQVDTTHSIVENNSSKVAGQQPKKAGNLASPLADTITTAALTAKKSKADKKIKTPRVYAGILAGGDISTVKFQSVKNVGFNLGVLLGYQVNRLIAIETGAVWDKKFYYSKGDYFNTKNIYLPPNGVIAKVEGNCSMIELPINIKYNLKSSGQTTWFSLIGLSTYFMKTENYDYLLDTSGVYYNRNRTYTNSTSNWLSIMNISVGYSHTFGKRKSATLRIEPYFKIPLKGVGIGSLPITSTGINIGFTKAIF